MGERPQQTKPLLHPFRRYALSHWLEIGTNTTSRSAGPSEADIRKRLALEEEEELKRSEEPISEGGTRVRYLRVGLDLEESQ